VVRSPEQLGDRLSWSVDGKSPHSVEPELSRKKSDYVNTADYRASWPVGCDELRELAIGKTVRLATPNFTAEIPLAGFTQQLNKVFGITQQSLIDRSAGVCQVKSSPSGR
jgi:hypothetical protein